MKNMYVHNASFSVGRYAIIKFGDKWLDLVRPGEHVRLIDYDSDREMTTCQVSFVEKMPFDKISDYMLDVSINQHMKNREQAIVEMKSIYSDFDENEDVVLIMVEVEAKQ